MQPESLPSSSSLPLSQPSLGSFLRHQREQRGITLEQVASATKIGIKTLYFLENDQYTELPAKPFVRGFVISYSKFIGLNSQEILREYEDYLQQKSLERPRKDSGHSGYAFERRGTTGEGAHRTSLLIALGGFLGLGLLALFLFKPSLTPKKRSHLEKLSVAPATVATPPPAPTPAPPPPIVSEKTESVPIVEVVPPSVKKGWKAGENPKDPLDSGLELKPSEIQYRVVFKMAETVWVRYQLDDRPVRKFPVKKGNLLILRAKERLIFQASQQAGVSVSYNRQAEVPLAAWKDLFVLQNTPTLTYPASLKESVPEKWGTLTPLPTTPEVPELAPPPKEPSRANPPDAP